MAEFATKGTAGTALGLSIGSLGAQALNGGLGNLFGGVFGANRSNCCTSENMPVNRYELGLEQKVASLEASLALRDANIYGDQKLLEVYKYFDGKVEGINQRLCDQAVWNATQSANISCLAGQVAALNGLTKYVIPAENVCPAPMPQYNSWTAPTTTTTG